jgi:hypothetical protein
VKINFCISETKHDRRKAPILKLCRRRLACRNSGQNPEELLTLNPNEDVFFSVPQKLMMVETTLKPAVSLSY